MRIAFLVDQFPSLSETFILNQITGLIDRGHEVDIYGDRPGNMQKTHAEIQQYNLLERTYYTPIPTNALGRIISAIFLFLRHFFRAPKVLLRAINFVRYNSTHYGKPASFLKPLYLIIPWLDKAPYDVILCHYGRNGLKAILLRDLGITQGKIAVFFHGYDISRYLDMHGENTYNYLFQQADLLLPISQHWQKKLIDLGCNPNKTLVHHMGINCIKFNYIKPSSQEQFSLLSVARLVEKKGLEYSIRAVAQLIPHYPNLQYRIIGDGVLKQELENLIKQLNVSNQIKLLGWKQQQEIINIMENSALVLAPSVTSHNGDCEGIPVCLMESMAKGLAVISTYHSGIPELIEDGRSGYLLPERDISGIVNTIKILLNDIKLRTKIGLAGRQKVEQEYNIELLNNRLEEILQQLL
jgi:colanic acid/amylovoran biosynthesis glycosyltransferase